MYPVKRTYWFDIYKVKFFVSWLFLLPLLFLLKDMILFTMSLSLIFLNFVQNIDKIPLVRCPVLVIHVSVHNSISCICHTKMFLVIYISWIPFLSLAFHRWLNECINKQLYLSWTDLLETVGPIYSTLFEIVWVCVVYVSMAFFGKPWLLVWWQWNLNIRFNFSKWMLRKMFGKEKLKRVYKNDIK